MDLCGYALALPPCSEAYEKCTYVVNILASPKYEKEDTHLSKHDQSATSKRTRRTSLIEVLPVFAEKGSTKLNPSHSFATGSLIKVLLAHFHAPAQAFGVRQVG